MENLPQMVKYLFEVCLTFVSQIWLCVVYTQWWATCPFKLCIFVWFNSIFVLLQSSYSTVSSAIFIVLNPFHSKYINDNIEQNRIARWTNNFFIQYNDKDKQSWKMALGVCVWKRVNSFQFKPLFVCATLKVFVTFDLVLCAFVSFVFFSWNSENS